MQIGKISREEREMVLLMRQIRAEIPVGNLAIVLQDELDGNRLWLAQRDYENQLMQVVIDGMIKGKTPCEYCEELAEGSCKGSEFGCRNWWLRFLTDEEKEKCRKRAFGDEQGTKAVAEEASDGDGRDADGRATGEGSEQDALRGVGGRPQ